MKPMCMLAEEKKTVHFTTAFYTIFSLSVPCQPIGQCINLASFCFYNGFHHCPLPVAFGLSLERYTLRDVPGNKSIRGDRFIEPNEWDELVRTKIKQTHPPPQTELRRKRNKKRLNFGFTIVQNRAFV